MLRLTFCLLATISSCLLLAQDPSPHLLIDQFGYLPNADKVAVLADPQQGQNTSSTYTPGPVLEVRDANTDAVVWSGAPQIWNGGATYEPSGDKGWWLDFSSLTATGAYYLIDPSNGQRSGNFNIGNDVYAALLKDAGRAFYYNRCNATKAAPFAESNWTDGMNFMNPLQDGDCSYVNDRENTSLRRDLSGGWFDAGDYNKYVTFAQGAVHPLLWAYFESPAAFSDDWNIPESGNGIPDILDELKWEVDWLRKMVNADGTTINKMGSISFAENAAAPPSINTDRRYYGPTCTSSSIAAAAMLAHAASVFQDIPQWEDYAVDITEQAEAAFDYWVGQNELNLLETNCDDGTINAGDADQNEQEQREVALTAAVHLFDVTGESVYNDYVRDNISDAEYFTTNWWGPYKNAFTSAMVHYLSLPGADAATVTALKNSMTPIVRDDWNGFYGFNEDGLYRAFMTESSYHWGSNSVASQLGNLNRMMIRADIVPGIEEDFNRKADGMVHYLHGVNPLGFVYLSGMEGRGAEKGIQEIYHTWFADGTDWDNSETSLFGPAPGFVSGGANQSFTIGSIAPPAGEPAMKSYLDWNTGFPENSWEITEPAIYYQAAYLRNLAAMAANDALLPVLFLAPLSGRSEASHIVLEWKVAEEIDADFYAIEYLDDQDQWLQIGRVKATGATNYRFIHKDPRDGTNQYRLMPTDLDGKFSYTNIVSVVFADLFKLVKVFPNPANRDGELHLQGIPNGTDIRLIDAAGREVLKRSNVSGVVVIPTVGLVPGVYHFELRQNASGLVRKEKLIIGN